MLIYTFFLQGKTIPFLKSVHADAKESEHFKQNN